MTTAKVQPGSCTLLGSVDAASLAPPPTTPASGVIAQIPIPTGWNAPGRVLLANCTLNGHWYEQNGDIYTRVVFGGNILAQVINTPVNERQMVLQLMGRCVARVGANNRWVWQFIACTISLPNAHAVSCLPSTTILVPADVATALVFEGAVSTAGPWVDPPSADVDVATLLGIAPNL